MADIADKAAVFRIEIAPGFGWQGLGFRCTKCLAEIRDNRMYCTDVDGKHTGTDMGKVLQNVLTKALLLLNGFRN